MYEFKESDRLNLSKKSLSSSNTNNTRNLIKNNKRELNDNQSIKSKF